MNYPQLQARARAASRGRGARALVQVGGCSRSVGAAEVFASLRDEVDRRGLNASVVQAGCDGACYEAPTVIVETGDGRVYRLAGVSQADIIDVVDGWLASAPSRGRGWRGQPAMEWSPGHESPAFWSGQTRLVLENVGLTNSTDLDEYVAKGGYSALDRVLSSLSPEQVIDRVLAADLRGRGGAYFPAARKWQGARATGRSPCYLIVNAEEGEPGIYKDRHVMEGDPYRLLEGTAIAAYAIGAKHVYLYINGEAHLSSARMVEAIDKAQADGLVGDNVLDTDLTFHIEVRRGAGGYVLGEESALMNSIEGQRNMPRTRPPFPVESGLWGRPTVINNVETLCNLPVIFADGESIYSEVGTGSSRGTKVLSLSGSVRRPGLVEVPMGTSVREIVFDIGGGPLDGREIIGVVAGGPSGGLLSASRLDVAIGPGPLDSEGAVLGSGGITVLDDSVSSVQVVRRLAAYNAAEACGKCTPCREGTKRMLDILDGLADGKGRAPDLEALSDLTDVVGFGSLCGLGQMAPGPVRSGLAHFKEDFARAAETG